ncbi:MAG: hypothetical protein AAGI53_11005 [Planctomycetota bacterium]
MRDDRGQKVFLRARGPIVPARVNRRPTVVVWIPARVDVLVVLAAIAITLGFVVQSSALPQAWHVLARVVGSLIIVLFGVSFVFRIVAEVIAMRDASRPSAETARGRFAGSRLDDRLCGGCGYPLDGLSLGEDGCVVCPECGAAWNVSGDSSSQRPASS